MQWWLSLYSSLDFRCEIIRNKCWPMREKNCSLLDRFRPVEINSKHFNGNMNRAIGAGMVCCTVKYCYIYNILLWLWLRKKTLVNF